MLETFPGANVHVVNKDFTPCNPDFCKLGFFASLQLLTEGPCKQTMARLFSFIHWFLPAGWHIPQGQDVFACACLPACSD